LDHMWELNAAAYRQLAPHGNIFGVAFLELSAALAIAGTGWLRRRVWGWRLAVAIIATQVLGDVVTVFTGQWVKGGVGVMVAVGLLLYLESPRVQAAFEG
jgi:hypothetical protein